MHIQCIYTRTHYIFIDTLYMYMVHRYLYRSTHAFIHTRIHTYTIDDGAERKVSLQDAKHQTVVAANGEATTISLLLRATRYIHKYIYIYMYIYVYIYICIHIFSLFLRTARSYIYLYIYVSIFISIYIYI